MSEERRSIADVTREYIDTRPSVRDCLALGIMNYTLLARRIMDELGLKNEEAVTVACRRYQMELEKKETHQSAIQDLLAESAIELKNKVAVLVLRGDYEVVETLMGVLPRLMLGRGPMQVIMSHESVTMITEEKKLDEVLKLVEKGDVDRQSKDLAQIVVKSPVKIEEVSGVLAYLSGILAEYGINIVEAYSCYPDTVFIVSEKEVMRAYGILSKIIDRAEGSRQ
jgi:hypothetical protein